MTIKIRPIESWPWPQTEDPSYSPFSAKWTATAALLKRELAQLGVDDAIVEIDVREQDLRNDGWIRSNARPSSDRVILSFEMPDVGWLRYPCDRFRGRPWNGIPGWQANLRAIALGLEALRKVDRYGITSQHEQYRGFRALPSGNQPTTTREEAARILAQQSRMAEHEILRSGEVAKLAAADALKTTHPDQGGDAEDFADVQRARIALGLR